MAISSTSIPSLGSNYEVITSTGTWTPPTGYSVFDVIILGAGGGGGGGAYTDGVTNAYCYGGAGGAAGYGILLQRYRITTSVSVTIGTGGAGGAGAPAAGSNGSDGTAGGATVFNNITAPGGAAGEKGYANAGSAANAGPSTTYGCKDSANRMYVAGGTTSSSTSYGPFISRGGSGGSNGGNVPYNLRTGTVPFGTAGGSVTALTATGGLYGGTSGNGNLNGYYASNTDTQIGAYGVAGGLGQESFGGYPTYSQTTYQTLTTIPIRAIGNLWWVPGGGGAGMGLTTTNGYGEAGYAGTATAGGLHGYSTQATNTYIDAVAATAYGAGGGGGGSSYNTGTRAGNGGAGGNGVVIIYWGM